MQELIKALKGVLPTLIPKLASTKFLLCLIVIIGGLVGGGTEGFAAAVAALGFYTGAKTYQNVQFDKNGNAKK